MKTVIVKQSKIHGKGVFATKNFKKGEIVLKWDISNTIKKQDIIKLPATIKKMSMFIEESILFHHLRENI